jgi:hypothetical protein
MSQLDPAEFSTLLEVRKWHKHLVFIRKNQSPKYWMPAPAFVYVNMNTGRSMMIHDDLMVN